MPLGAPCRSTLQPPASHFPLLRAACRSVALVALEVLAGLHLVARQPLLDLRGTEAKPRQSGWSGGVAVPTHTQPPQRVCAPIAARSMCSMYKDPKAHPQCPACPLCATHLSGARRKRQALALVLLPVAQAARLLLLQPRLGTKQLPALAACGRDRRQRAEGAAVSGAAGSRQGCHGRLGAAVAMQAQPVGSSALAGRLATAQPPASPQAGARDKRSIHSPSSTLFRRSSLSLRYLCRPSSASGLSRCTQRGMYEAQERKPVGADQGNLGEYGSQWVGQNTVLEAGGAEASKRAIVSCPTDSMQAAPALPPQPCKCHDVPSKQQQSHLLVHHPQPLLESQQLLRLLLGRCPRLVALARALQAVLLRGGAALIGRAGLVSMVGLMGRGGARRGRW